MGKEYRLEDYFASTGFYDLLPLALDLIGNMGFTRDEAIMAVCMVFDKSREYPPTTNRTAWFIKVFQEKLGEVRADIARANYLKSV